MGRKKRGRGAGKRKEGKRGGDEHPVELRTGEKVEDALRHKEQNDTKRVYI